MGLVSLELNCLNKACLSEFLHSEMMFHAKALEAYSKAQTLVRGTDYTADIEVS
jgi:hypothetical protein